MNPRRYAILLLAVPFALAEAQRSDVALASPLTLSVTADHATVRIPIVPRAVWSWNLPGTPPSAVEYEFRIELESGMGFSFGFQRFKSRPDAEPASGTMAQLLQTGQLSVWQTNRSAGAVVEGARLALSHDDATLTLSVTDPVTLRLLFRDRPHRALLVMQTPEEGRSRTPIFIDYEER